MAAFSSSSSHLLSPPPTSLRRLSFRRLSTSVTITAAVARKYRKLVVFATTSPSSSFDDLNAGGHSSLPKKSVLSDLIQEIEPLDISLIQKDVPPTTIDAMKRTISGMLGLLPSNQFQILIEALWEPLSRLLVSSMMTGYTLRNAEYRLCLERNLDILEDGDDNHKQEVYNLGLKEMLLDSVRRVPLMDKSETIENTSEENVENFGEISPEIQSYISHLQARLSSAKKELNEVKRKNAALQMQQFVGEEKNELLDYLRSLQPEKVVELSEPTSPEVKEIINSVVHGLLATLSPKMHSKAPHLTEKNSSGAVNVGNEDCAELLENTSLNFHPIISLTRDYLARLLFWCMLLGHYLRGLEYRAQLMEIFMLSPDNEDNSLGGDEQVE